MLDKRVAKAELTDLLELYELDSVEEMNKLIDFIEDILLYANKADTESLGDVLIDLNSWWCGV